MKNNGNEKQQNMSLKAVKLMMDVENAYGDKPNVDFERIARDIEHGRARNLSKTGMLMGSTECGRLLNWMKDNLKAMGTEDDEFYDVPVADVDLMAMSLKQVLRNSYTPDTHKNAFMGENFAYDERLSTKEHQIYFNPESRVLLMSITGTHNIYDIATDIMLAFGKLKDTDRFKDARKALRSAKEVYAPRKTVIVGHSLGGTIAQYIAGGDDIVFTYNKAVTVGQKTRANESAFRTRGDLISLLGKGMIKTMKTKSSKNPVKAHRISSLMEDIDVLGSKNDFGLLSANSADEIQTMLEKLDQQLELNQLLFKLRELNETKHDFYSSEEEKRVLVEKIQNVILVIERMRETRSPELNKIFDELRDKFQLQLELYMDVNRSDSDTLSSSESSEAIDFEEGFIDDGDVQVAFDLLSGRAITQRTHEILFQMMNFYLEQAGRSPEGLEGTINALQMDVDSINDELEMVTDEMEMKYPDEIKDRFNERDRKIEQIAKLSTIQADTSLSVMYSRGKVLADVLYLPVPRVDGENKDVYPSNLLNSRVMNLKTAGNVKQILEESIFSLTNVEELVNLSLTNGRPPEELCLLQRVYEFGHELPVTTQDRRKLRRAMNSQTFPIIKNYLIQEVEMINDLISARAKPLIWSEVFGKPLSGAVKRMLNQWEHSGYRTLNFNQLYRLFAPNPFLRIPMVINDLPTDDNFKSHRMTSKDSSDTRPEINVEDQDVGMDEEEFVE